VQISGINQLKTNKNRYECTLSDGRISIGAITGTDVATKIATGDIKDGSIVEMVDYACNTINGVPKIVVTGKLVSSFI
jgi:hypothetical protein